MGWPSKMIAKCPMVFAFQLGEENHSEVFGYSSFVIEGIGKERYELDYCCLLKSSSWRNL
jgi:hypothetical protein